ncbi:hypothetical protein ACNSTQ_17315 [Alkalihalobacterium sp. APHAB7]
MIFTGKITKGWFEMWELPELNEAFPRTAKPFIGLTGAKTPLQALKGSKKD